MSLKKTKQKSVNHSVFVQTLHIVLQWGDREASFISDLCPPPRFQTVQLTTFNACKATSIPPAAVYMLRK